MVSIDALFDGSESEPQGEPLYDLIKGMHGNNGAPRLDEVQARELEDRSAKIEGRDPVYVTPVTGDELRRANFAEAGAVITAPVIGYK